MQNPSCEEIKLYCMPKTLINLNDSLRRFCIDEHYWDLEDEETLSRGRSAVCEPLTFITWNCGHNMFILSNGHPLSGIVWFPVVLLFNCDLVVLRSAVCEVRTG